MASSGVSRGASIFRSYTQGDRSCQLRRKCELVWDHLRRRRLPSMPCGMGSAIVARPDVSWAADCVAPPVASGHISGNCSSEGTGRCSSSHWPGPGGRAELPCQGCAELAPSAPQRLRDAAWKRSRCDKRLLQRRVRRGRAGSPSGLPESHAPASLGRANQHRWPAGASVFKSHSGWVFSVVISADERKVATGSDDRTARLWDVASGQFIATLEARSRGPLRRCLQRCHHIQVGCHQWAR